ncbi:Asp-tRNA(Asn)/Glu-tRNA(Gln) amidotransferase subunit GatC [soil metagenome]
MLKVARLARLEVSAEQAAGYARDLSAVLGYMETLKRLDLGGVEPMSSPIDGVGVAAADVVGEMLPCAALRGMAPKMEGAFIGVPKVIGGGGGAA